LNKTIYILISHCIYYNLISNHLKLKHLHISNYITNVLFLKTWYYIPGCRGCSRRQKVVLGLFQTNLRKMFLCQPHVDYNHYNCDVSFSYDVAAEAEMTNCRTGV